MNRLRVFGRATLWRKPVHTIALAVCMAAMPAALMQAQTAGNASGGDITAPLSPPISRPYAWEHSLALEALGDIRGALNVMVMRYGAQPAMYVPCVRVAWLHLQLGEYEESVALYRRARQLDRDEPEAPAGLALALTGRGYRALDRGDFPTARVAWEDALTLTPTQPDALRGLTLVGRSDEIGPEAWVGRVYATQNSSSTSVLYAQIPVRFRPWLSARAAVRRVSAPSLLSTSESFFGAQTELFGAVQVEHGNTSTEVVGLRFSNFDATNNGGAVHFRLGGRQGFTLTGSHIQTTSGSNVQISPTVFRWVRPSLKLTLGSRVTSDSAFTGVSGLAGMTWLGKEATVDVRVHAGKERWAFNIAGPTVLSFLAETSGGAAVTASVPFGPELSVSVQAQMENTLSHTLGRGRYSSFSLGARYTPLAINR